MRTGVIGVLAATVVLAGCSSSGGLKPFERRNQFPKEEKIEKLKQKPKPTKVFEEVDSIAVPYWRLSGPLPDLIGPVPRSQEDELDALAANAVATVENGVATEAMRCVARELGEYYLAYGGSPDKMLQRFIEHRCGSTASAVSSSWTYWDSGGLTWSEVKGEDDGVVHGWSFVPAEAHLKRVNRFLDHVKAARRARGNDSPRKIAKLKPVAKRLADELESGEMKLHVAAKRLVDAMAKAHPGKPVRAFYIEAHDPTEVEIPTEILDMSPLRVAVVVSPYKPPNSPWYVYGVVFAYVKYESATNVAGLPDAAEPLAHR